MLALKKAGSSSPLLTILVPVHNESDVLDTLYLHLSRVIRQLTVSVELLFVDDGSVDSSLKILQRYKRIDPRVGILSLSRRFGKELAVSAGIKYANGDALIIMDADLQDPPECIPDMVQAWLKGGYDVVAMRRQCRSSDSWQKRLSARFFYRFLNAISDIDIPENVGDFRLITRTVIDALNRLPEQNRYMKGLFAWVGFNTLTLDFERPARFRGNSKWATLKLVKLAMDGLTAFSIKPLRLATVTGFICAIFAFAFGAYYLLKAAVYGDPVAGFPTLVTVITFLGGMQLLAIGLLGEYIGRMFVETKRRPLYLVKSYVPATSSAQSPGSEKKSGRIELV